MCRKEKARAGEAEGKDRRESQIKAKSRGPGVLGKQESRASCRRGSPGPEEEVEVQEEKGPGMETMKMRILPQRGLELALVLDPDFS
mmetsp:Transcript_97903/g.174345  ORF Transcript_97903/g.174345 Transcript_97903/m.174345 type:complete len:87 (+) Transcript_97903:189-449(+)